MINEGPNSGKLCVIIDIIDQNRALVSGPATGVRRQSMSFKKMRLTRFMVDNIHPTIGDKRLLLKWQKTSISDDFAKTKAGSKLIAKKKVNTEVKLLRKIAYYVMNLTHLDRKGPSEYSDDYKLFCLIYNNQFTQQRVFSNPKLIRQFFFLTESCNERFRSI